MTQVHVAALGGLLMLFSAQAVSVDTLPQAVQKAVKTHPQIKQSVHMVREGEERIREAEAGYLPTVDVTADWGYQVVDNATTRANRTDDETWNNGQVGFEARQNLFGGFNTQNEVARTKAFTKARSFQLRATQDSIGLEASRAYLNVIRYRNMLELAQENLKNHQQIFKQISSRVERGVGTLADKSQIESRLNSAESNVIAARNNVLDAEYAFIQLIGESAPAQLSSFSFSESWLPLSRELAQDLALKQNPSILSSQSDIEEAESSYQSSKSSNYPNIDLVVFGDYGEDLSGIEGSDSNYGAMLQVRWNLFRGGSDKGRQRASAYVVEQARAINMNTHREVTQRTHLAWSAFEMLAKQKIFLDKYVSASEKTRNAYKKEFNLGKRTLLDLLDSENELFSARNQLLDASAEYEIAKARVLEVVGELRVILERQVNRK